MLEKKEILAMSKETLAALVVQKMTQEEQKNIRMAMGADEMGFDDAMEEGVVDEC